MKPTHRPAAMTGDTVVVHDLSHDGRGVARVGGKTVFIHGALPGEEVRLRLLARKSRFDEAVVTAIVNPSAQRCVPRCGHYGKCGGCSLQHLDAAAQTRYKQAHLAQTLERIGKVRPEQWLNTLGGPPWAYRSRARFTVEAGAPGGGCTLGFKRAASRHTESVRACPVLDPVLEALIAPLQTLLPSLAQPHLLREVLVATGESTGTSGSASCWVADAQLPESDRALLVQFGAAQHCTIYLKTNATTSPERLWPEKAETLCYTVGGDLQLAFQPWHFTQTNRLINGLLVDAVVRVLQPRASDHVLDLFCGIGNFTLPLARHSAQVIGLESDGDLLDWARRNAAANGIANASFMRADLVGDPRVVRRIEQRPDLILLDPPRSGAAALLPELARLRPRRICYVSCDAATFARDAGQLVKQHGFRLESVGMLDMFPQTNHFESMALFICSKNAQKNARSASLC